MLLASTANSLYAQGKKEDLAAAFFKAKTVAFLGDSNTYQGEFITALEACLIANGKKYPAILNLGLSSETCSGDSEPGHPWPRPNVHERFERTLAKAKPDILFVNYGMNDGIYHPFDESRFERYKAGINKIIEAAQSSDGKLKVVLVTPPPFDPLPGKLSNSLANKDAKEFGWRSIYKNYDSEVMSVYADWILAQKDRVLECVDIRSAIEQMLENKRKQEPDFCPSKDGVHFNSEIHKLIGLELADSLGVDPSKKLDDRLYRAIRLRQDILRSSWLTEIGHKRPNVKPGMPLKEAQRVSRTINGLIDMAMSKDNK